MNIGETLYKNRIHKKLTIEEISKELMISKDILLKIIKMWLFFIKEEFR